MPSEQEQFFCIQKTNLLQDDESDRLCVSTSDITIEKSTFEPTISDIVANGLKNVKIELPRVNIPNEIMFKHEIDKYMKLFQCKEKPVEASFIQMDMNGNSVNYSEIYIPHNKSGLHYEDGLKTAKILNFSCTKCQNNIRYSPNDLQKHFQLLHQGELPSYPCEMCNFSANDFQSFNQHRRTHRSTLVKCEICNDDHRYTLLDLTKHFTSQHCVNGNFQCEKCRFSTQDVGTFVQHIHRHNEIQYNCEKCHHVSFSEEEFQKHAVSHTGTFPFSCQYCNYMASRKNYLLKHIITLHKDHLYAKDKMNTNDNEKRVKNSTGLKLILKRYKTGASRKALWRRKKITDGCRTEEEEDVFEVFKESLPKSEEIGQSVKELHNILLNEKLVYSGTKSCPAIQYNRAEGGLGSTRGLMKKAVHGPTVLMVKNNKISVPANYSAKFLGFKTVDGKQHIVIKLLPTEKQNLPGGNKFDGIKDGTTERQEETADNRNLPLVARSHEINNQIPRNNSVHLSTSPSSNQFSGKIKQEGNVLCCNASQNIVPPIVMVGKCANRLPVKPETSSFPCDLVVKTRSPVSWKNCIPQDHPQVLSPSGSHMLHYDPMKKPFPPEFKVVNGEVNNNNKHSNLYCSSTDFSNQAPLPFHNYSKIGILEKSKELTCNKMYPLQSKPTSESMPCFSQSVTELNLGKKSHLPFGGFVNGNNTPVFSTSLPTHSIDKQCWLENHDGQLYLNTKVNQMLEHVAEKSKQENDSNCVNSSLMPKITSVFSLQSKQASTYLSPEINQSLQEVLKRPTIVQSNNYVKTNYDRSFSNKYTNCRTFTHNDLSPYCSLTDSSDKFKRELNMNNTARNESVYLKNRGQIPLPLRTEAINSASGKTSVGALLKNQTDSIITQQLAKDKMRYNIHGPSKICPFFPEQKKTALQSTPPRFFVPLQLARKQGLQVISGRPSPKVSSSDAQTARTASLLLNKRPGMILTFGRGSLGTAANAAENNSQVLEKIASKKPVSSDRDLQTNDSRSLRNSSINTCSEAVNASSIAIPQIDQHNITNPESGLSSLNILAGFQGSKAACAKSVKQPEVGQEQPVYALLPNGRQAVFLKCMSSNKSLVQNHSIFQGPTHSQSSEPKKHGAMQQKLFLKIKTFPAAEKCQPVSNTVSSLQLNSVKCCNSPALNQKNTARPSSNALYLSGSLMPANASSANGKSKDFCSSVGLVHSSRDGKMWSQKTPLDSTQKETAMTGSSLENQRATENMSTQISKVKRHPKQNDAKVSYATVSQKNKNLKRKTKDDFQGPPRKKTLHRKCKEKNQLDVNEFESLFQTPYRPRASKDTVRILNLLPFHSKQLVKCPRRNQPVVVLNHPDADVPEVVNVMKTIAKFKGHVLKVSLSKRTIDALLEPPYSNSLFFITNELTRRKHKMLKPVSPVKERFVLKLTLKKTSKNNYQIVKTTSDNTLKTKFSCWFCGRVFDNQDNWVGHGQRHLMEATRDWNSLE